MNKIPIVDVNLKRICLDFGVKDIITIYNYLFLESRILFFCNDIECLNSYIYGFLSFLYPFQYQYQIITILPKENFEIIESITPFIAGINQAYEEKFFENNNFVLSDCFFIVDIDQKKYFVINEENKLPEFPRNFKKILEKKLQDLINKSLKDVKKIKNNIDQKKNNLRNSSAMRYTTAATISFSSDPNESKLQLTNTISTKDTTISLDAFKENENEEDLEGDKEFSEMLSNSNIDYNFNQEVNVLFFNFNANLLANYNNYLNRDFYSSNTMPSLEILFKVNEYLKKVPNNDKAFYEKSN